MYWNYAYSPIIWPSFSMGLFLLALAVYSWRQRSVPGALPFVVACLFGAAIAAGSVLEYAALDAASKIFWYKFQAANMLPVVTALFCFILEYAWPGHWLTRRNLILLALMPLAFLGLIVTNGLHHLAWVSFQANGTVRAEFGPGNWVVVIYTFLILGAINLFVFGWLFLRSPQHRWPVALMLVGQLGGHLVWTMAKAHFFHTVLPIALFAMVFEFFMYAVAFFGFRILDPIPLARNSAIEQLHIGMLVLDPLGGIVSLNPAAERILATTLKAARGKQAGELLPAYPPGTGKGLLETELSLGDRPESRVYRMEVSALKDWRGLDAGRLLMLRDITEEKHAQAQIIEQQKALAILHEREQLARELHDSTGQVLGYVKLQAQAARDRLKQDQKEAVDSQLAQLVAVAQDAHADVREFILAAKIGVSGEPAFLPALRQYLQRFNEQYGMSAELVETGAWSDSLLEPTVAVQLLRIIQEALTNVRKHAGARRVQVILEEDGNCARVIILDEGSGFDPALRPGTPGQKFGLGFMRDRAAEVGGSVRLHSAPGQGTRVVVEAPLAGGFTGDPGNSL